MELAGGFGVWAPAALPGPLAAQPPGQVGDLRAGRDSFRHGSSGCPEMGTGIEMQQSEGLCGHWHWPGTVRLAFAGVITVV